VWRYGLDVRAKFHQAAMAMELRYARSTSAFVITEDKLKAHRG
jgi:hypothetical protein